MVANNVCGWISSLNNSHECYGYGVIKKLAFSKRFPLSLYHYRSLQGYTVSKSEHYVKSSTNLDTVDGYSSRIRRDYDNDIRKLVMDLFHCS